MAIALVLWAEWSTWHAVSSLRQQTLAVSSQSFHLSDHLEARVRAMEVLAAREPFTKATQTKIREEAEEIRRWWEPHRAQAGTRHRAALEDFGRRFDDYLVLVAAEGPESGNPTRAGDASSERPERLQRVLVALGTLSGVERQSLAEHLEGTRDSLDRVHRRLLLSSGILVSMGAVLALLLYLGVIAPLRERLRLSRVVMDRQEKLGSLGVLAAGVAHEIRNPLTSIKARLFTQQELLPNPSEAREDNVFITEEISRLEQIVRDFLAFARPSEPHLVRIKATRPLRELEAWVRAGAERGGVRLEQEFLADPWVRADPNQLKQVFLNLIRNATEALAGQGTIKLRTRTERRSRLRHPTNVAILEVEDDGPGISPEVQRRLFDPFFTTKANGTGLGLSIAARIIEAHGGTLEYESGGRRGALFRVVLPIHDLHEPTEHPAG